MAHPTDSLHLEGLLTNKATVVAHLRGELDAKEGYGPYPSSGREVSSLEVTYYYKGYFNK